MAQLSKRTKILMGINVQPVKALPDEVAAAKKEALAGAKALEQARYDYVDAEGLAYRNWNALYTALYNLIPETHQKAYAQFIGADDTLRKWIGADTITSRYHDLNFFYAPDRTIALHNEFCKDNGLPIVSD